MRVTVSHNKSKVEVIAAIDRAIQRAFTSLSSGAVEITDLEKSWQDSTMTFSFIAKAGFFKNPIHGTVDVTDTDLTVDADLGMFGKFVSQEKATSTIETQVRDLLA